MTRVISLVRILALLVVLGLLPTQSRAAEAPADKPVAGKAEVEQLVATIEDPAARQKLVAQLKLLVAADNGATEGEEGGLLPLISDQMQELSDEILATVGAFAEAGHVVDWVEQQVGDPKARNHWSDVLGKLLAVLGGGILIERLLHLALGGARRMVEARRPHNRWVRLPLAVGRWLLDLLPVAAFAATAYALLALPALRLTGDASLAAILLVTAYAAVRGGLVLAQALFMPGVTGIRVLPLDDETANYLFIWARRLTYTGVWGYFAIQALKLLGLPKSGYTFSIKMLGLVLTTLLIILVLQNRHTVARWIRSQGHATGLSGKVQALRNRLADIWHILAALYIVASFAIWALQVKGGFEFVVRASLLSVLILVAGNVLGNALGRLVERAFAIGEELRRQFPQLEGRANRYLAIMHNVVRGAVALGILLGIAQAWGANTLAWLGSELGRHLLASGLSIFAVLVGALIVWELLNSSIERYMAQTDQDGNAVERSARARTLLPLLRHVVMGVLLVLVVLIVLSELGVNIGPLLAGAGVVGVAIGFGSQKLVQDVITGAFILFENTIAIGDTVKIGDHTGTVEGMTIRTMRLRDVNGQVHTLPFSNVTTITNMSRDFGGYLFDFGVSYREDVDQVIAVLRQLGDELRQDAEIGATVIEPIEIFGVDRFTDSAVVIRGRLKTLPGKQWAIGREFNRRVKNRFDALAIEMPYPSSTIYFGEDKEGRAAPAHIRLERGGAPPPAQPQAQPAAAAAEIPIGEPVRID